MNVYFRCKWPDKGSLVDVDALVERAVRGEAHAQRQMALRYGGVGRCEGIAACLVVVQAHALKADYVDVVQVAHHLQKRSQSENMQWASSHQGWVWDRNAP